TTIGAAPAMGATRCQVACSIVCSPTSGRNCLGWASRDSGHRRVPDPPDSNTGCSLATAISLRTGWQFNLCPMQPDPDSKPDSRRDSDPRGGERLAWAREALDVPAAGLERASVDAGFRSYWRTSGAGANSRIVMDSPPDREDVRPWLRIRDLLE